MADFTALKTAIQNAIKQNGNEEITGNLLQEVLLAIVTTLGDGSISDLITALGSEATTRQQADDTLQQNINAEAQARQQGDSTLQGGINTAMQAINAINNAIGNGCVYAGIATPSTTPAAGKVFYLALTAGTYTNFNGLEVSQGINILKNNGSTWSLESFVGIDDAPIPSSQKLVKSGGVLDSIIKDGSAFDLSAYNGGATYADLNAALTALNALPSDFKKGGMSMKFILTFDNNYIQFRYMSSSTAVADFTNVANWQGVDDVPNPESDNLFSSRGAANTYGSYNENPEYLELSADKLGRILYGVKKNGDFFFAKGIPAQIKKHMEEVYGRYSENPEFIDLITDFNQRVLWGIKEDGDVYYGKGVPTQIKEYVKNSGQRQNDELSKRYVKSSATLGIGSVLHARPYTLQYFDDGSDVFLKAGMSMARAYVSSEKEIRVHHLLPVYDLYKRGLDILAMTSDIEKCNIEELATKMEWYVTRYDGNLHSDLVYYEDGDSKEVGIKVVYWNFFNEPDRDSYWVNNKGELLERMEIIYTTIKKLRPECKVVFGGFSSFAYNNFFEDFSGIRDANGKAFWDYCDIIGYHLYSTNYEWLKGEFELFRKVANQNYSIDEYSHLIDKPVWSTECGIIPFTEANIEGNRKNYLPKSVLHLLSYGVERVLMYRLVEYNMFVNQSSAQSYFGLTSPQFNCAWAGFHYNDNDKSSITPDNLLDKTYIYSNAGQISDAVYQPHLTLSEISKSGVISKGIAFSGDGFTLKKLVIGDFANGEVVEERVLWTGSIVMNGTNYVEIAGSAFEDADFGYQLIAEIENITMSDTSVDSIVYKDSYYSIKFLASLLNCVAEQPSVIDKGLYSIAKIKQYDGTCAFALWSNSSNVSVSIETSENATFWDVKGNKIDGDITVLTSSPVYITNVYGINVITNN